MDNDDFHDTILDFQLLPGIRESRHTTYHETPFPVYIASRPNALGPVSAHAFGGWLSFTA